VRCQLIVMLMFAACRPSDKIRTEFGAPIIEAYGRFEDEDAALAPVLFALEEQLYRSLEIDHKDTLKRSVIPPELTDAQVAGLEGAPDRDPGACIGMLVGFASSFSIEAHATLPLFADQRPLEPASPDHYDRTFLEGEDCWGDRSCLMLRTHQDLTKVYTAGFIPPIAYEFFKDFRWVDIGAEDGSPRWVYTARTWNPGSFSSENGKNTLLQSYTLEVWYPRDGRGFRFADTEEVPESQGDSDGGGVTRFQAVWSEQDIDLSNDPEMQAGTIRWGLDRNFQAHEDFLAAE
jgi:hypothetical protein